MRASLLQLGPLLALTLAASACSWTRFDDLTDEQLKSLARTLKATLVSASSAGGEAVAAATGTGWGTLKGRFLFAGTPGAPKALVADKDIVYSWYKGTTKIGSGRGKSSITFSGQITMSSPDSVIVLVAAR